MKMPDFKDKKVTIIGLGLLGGALNDAIFLAEHGARLTITDLKTAEELKPSLEKLAKYAGIKFVLGKHELEDFETADLILQPGNVPLNSPYLARAKENGIPIYVSESLFAQYVPDGVRLIGITGTRGKSTTAALIYEILKLQNLDGRQGCVKKDNMVYLAGNTKGVSTLALLDQVKPGDTVVMELDSWALHGMGDIKKSPNIAVFTNLMVDHQNFYGGGQAGMDAYFADKANIFLYQGENDHLVCGQEVLRILQKKFKAVSQRAIVPDQGVIPKSWKVKLLGDHNRQNIAYAVTVARLLDVPEKEIKLAVESFLPVPGRLELVGEINGVKYYNDTTATTPEAAIAAVEAVRSSLKKGGIVLVSGGADKTLEYGEYVKEVIKNVKALILFKGSATDKILEQLRKSLRRQAKDLSAQAGELRMDTVVVDNMENALDLARNFALKNDVVLLSPGAASFGIFKNEYDRGEQFVNLVKKMK